MDRERRVEVRAPLKASDRDIADFVRSRDDWLRRTLARMAEEPQPIYLRNVQGARHPYRGRVIVLHLETGSRRIVLDDDRLRVRLPDLAPEKISRALDRWYRERAREHFETAIDRHFPFFAERGHRRPVLRVKRMKSRWGSLSQRGYINLSLSLVQLPPVCLDYVVAHELCHLEQMNHGPRFHALMDRVMPDWRARSRLLNRLPPVVPGTP